MAARPPSSSSSSPSSKFAAAQLLLLQQQQQQQQQHSSSVAATVALPLLQVLARTSTSSHSNSNRCADVTGPTKQPPQVTAVQQAVLTALDRRDSAATIRRFLTRCAVDADIRRRKARRRTTISNDKNNSRQRHSQLSTTNERPRKRLRRYGKKEEADDDKADAAAAATSSSSSSTTTWLTPHWLWRTLGAYGAQERHCAALLLLQTASCCDKYRCPQHSSSSGDHNNATSESSTPSVPLLQQHQQQPKLLPTKDAFYQHWRLLCAIQEIIQERVVDVAAAATTPTSTPNSLQSRTTAAESTPEEQLIIPRLPLELVAVLKHLLFLDQNCMASSGVTSVGVPSDSKPDSSSIGSGHPNHQHQQRQHLQSQHQLLLAFCCLDPRPSSSKPARSASGLRWLTDSIWILVAALQQQHQRQHQYGSSGSSFVPFCQNALAALTDLLRCLTLRGAVPKELSGAASDLTSVLKKITGQWLWNLNSTAASINNGTNAGGAAPEEMALSPLACLIAARHSTATTNANTIVSKFPNTEAMDSVRSALEQLVDPAAPIIIVRQPSQQKQQQPKESSGKTGKQQQSPSRMGAEKSSSSLSRSRSATVTDKSSVPNLKSSIRSRSRSGSSGGTADNNNGDNGGRRRSCSASTRSGSEHEASVADHADTAITTSCPPLSASASAQASSLFARAIANLNYGESSSGADADDPTDILGKPDVGDDDGHDDQDIGGYTIEELDEDGDGDCCGLEHMDDNDDAAEEKSDHEDEEQDDGDEDEDDEDHDDDEGDGVNASQNHNSDDILEDEDIESMEEEEQEDGEEDTERMLCDEEEEQETVIRDEDADRLGMMMDLGDSSNQMELDLEGEDNEDKGNNNENDGDIVDEADAEITAAPSQRPSLPTTSSAISKLSFPIPQSHVAERKRMYIAASMQVLAAQHPSLSSQQTTAPPSTIPAVSSVPKSMPSLLGRGGALFCLEAEHTLLKTVNNIVKPPKKKLNTRVIMRRAPTQEEFFRGSLSRNPVSVSSLKPASGAVSSANRSSTTEPYEPTVADLRQHIANDLQMAESAELIEILVANKILDIHLKLRVVHQVLWKNYLMESSSSAQHQNLSSYLSSGSGAPFLQSTSSGGLSMIFTSGLSYRVTNGGFGMGGRGSSNITADTPDAALPPIVATYRLAGVDGEATEDTVNAADLQDPEAPMAAGVGSITVEEEERIMEKEYGVTRLVTAKRGVSVMLRSVQHSIAQTLRHIRRDDVNIFVGSRRSMKSNPALAEFRQSPPCPALTLLRYCSKLPSNRKLLLKARAPTVLLTLLLDVLRALEVERPTAGTSKGESAATTNPTAEILQELIEVLTSDISSNTNSISAAGTASSECSDELVEDSTADTDSMLLLLESIETISLSSPLRNVIAKLLPFLTYGKADLSQELAKHFDRHIVMDLLVQCETKKDKKTESSRKEQVADPAAAKRSILMKTFVQTAIRLPPNDVCNSLRLELIHYGFIERLTLFIAKGMPKQPPPWSPALWAKGEHAKGDNKAVGTKNKISATAGKSSAVQLLEEGWRNYFLRGGIRSALEILIGLCKKHPPTQERIVAFSEFVRACHWIEATSDHPPANACTNGLGLLTETLLDEMIEDNEDVFKIVESFRKQTKARKKELAIERRNRALAKMGSFGPLAGSGAKSASMSDHASSPLNHSGNRNVSSDSNTGRGVAASLLAPVLGLFRDTSVSNIENNAASSEVRIKEKNKPEKPTWLSEMESMEDETGLTCAVCQEGRTLQPSELLGLYAYVKKVSIPLDQCGSRANIDGTFLLKSLPSSLPPSLSRSRSAAVDWYTVGKAAGEYLPNSSFSSSSGSSGSRRNSLFTTTVSAGNGIHFSCHKRARSADRNHPKAPKSEWEGANLRNNRVNCNVILPLVSSRSSKVPLMAVDSALTDHQAAVSNLLGTTPRSMLWTVLHDIRLLLLRISHGEALNVDCGGGSLASNCELLFYQLLSAEMYDKDAQVDQPEQSQHAQGLSAGFLAACAIVAPEEASETSGHSGAKSLDGSGSLKALTRGIADAAPMASLSSILFHNANSCSTTNGEAQVCENKQRSKRQWVVGKEHFLRGLIICAGRRHALGLDTSGCQAGSNSRSGVSRGQKHAPSFVSWQTPAISSDDEAGECDDKRNMEPTVDDFQNALRPMVTLFAIFDKLSQEFSLSMEDVQVADGAETMVRVIEECYRSKNIHDLLNNAKVVMDHDVIIQLLQKGMMVAAS